MRPTCVIFAARHYHYEPSLFISEFPMTQVVLITGASLGIGKVTAESLARAGYRVFGTSRMQRPTADGITFLTLDVTDRESIHACVASVIAQAGRIDILINNAGLVGVVGGPEEVSDEQWRRVFDTNLMGVVGMVRAVLPHMRSQGSGRIINLSSLAGVLALPYFFAPYIASKHAIEGYTESLRAEVAPFGIKVAMVELGYMKTDIGLSVDQPAIPLDAYAPYRQRAYEMEQYALSQGRDPEIVAQVIERIARDPNPPLRNAAGQEAELLLHMFRPFPHKLFESFTRWLLIKPDPWQPEREPLRRAVLDTQYSDQLQRRSLLALMILTPLLLLGWLWQRNNRA